MHCMYKSRQMLTEYRSAQKQWEENAAPGQRLVFALRENALANVAIRIPYHFFPLQISRESAQRCLSTHFLGEKVTGVTLCILVCTQASEHQREKQQKQKNGLYPYGLKKKKQDIQSIFFLKEPFWWGAERIQFKLSGGKKNHWEICHSNQLDQLQHWLVIVKHLCGRQCSIIIVIIIINLVQFYLWKIKRKYRIAY